jgi:hypothetical protein
MAFKYNPITNQLDYNTSYGGSGGGGGGGGSSGEEEGGSGGGGGFWNLMGTQIITTPKINVTFNSLSSTFQEFYLVFSGINTSASDLLLIQTSSDNGVTILNCSYQLNANSISMFNYNNYILYTSNSSLNSKTGSIHINNISNSVCLIGSDANLGSNGGTAVGTLFTTNRVNFINLKTAGGSNLTGGSVNLYGK